MKPETTQIKRNCNICQKTTSQQSWEVEKFIYYLCDVCKSRLEEPKEDIKK
jgi:hypothetical protein